MISSSSLSPSLSVLSLSLLEQKKTPSPGLGVPFNVASYALLTRMLAHVCGLKAGDFVHSLGDAHVYANHVDPLREQLLNRPRPLPTLRIRPGAGEREIDGFEADDFELEGYAPHKKIDMVMAV